MPKATILICDDEVGVRESLKLILEEDYALAFVTNGDEAIAAVRTQTPDLVILDIKMPKAGGLEALRALKALTPRLKVVILSGYASSEIAAQAARLGADDYWTKPIGQAAVRAKIRALLNHT